MSRLALALAALVTLVPVAYADVAPPDQCNTAGASCTNAGTNYNEAGTCVATTCTRATPNGPMTYDCNRCELASALDMASTTPKKDSGCNVGGEAAGLSALFAIGAAFMARRRRGK